ncbi:MAG TPA: amidohydrolase family protein [Streptosporangiaceae bacterium]
MIIDSHGHISAPAEVYAYQAQLLASRGNPDSGAPRISAEQHEKSLQRHLTGMDDAGTDVQLISPRPFHMMHSVPPARIVTSWTRFVNDMIAKQVSLHPDRFVGVAGLPQFRDQPVGGCLAELERCVSELGFVGALVNPDPMEGQGPVPGLGDPFWYPLYEKFCELDVTMHIHSAGCASERESYTLHFINEESIAVVELLDSGVLDRFPGLRVLVSHGGGAIPYHAGRFRAWRIRKGLPPFEDMLRRLWYDTCIYSPEAVELLAKVVGPERMVLGTEFPGTGSAVDPQTGRLLDNMRAVIEECEVIDAGQRELVLEKNAMELFRLEPVLKKARQG